MKDLYVEHRRVHAQQLIDAIREHTLIHGWPPSQRTLSGMTGLNLQRVNTVLRYLNDEGLIEVGPNPREVRIVGTVMTIPEVTL